MKQTLSLKVAITLLFMLSTHALWSQKESSIWLETFDKNKYEWLEVNTPTAQARVENGEYLLFYNGNTSYDYFSSKCELDDRTSDYTISVALTQTDGDEKQDFGLLWGRKDNNNSFNFLISSNGYFKIIKFEGGKVSDICKSTRTGSVHPKGKMNVLEVRKQFDMLYFYINGYQVFQTPNLLFYGKMLGVSLNKNTTVSVDKIEVKSSPAITGELDYTQKATISATDNVLLSEDFRDNTNGWSVFNDKDASAKIEGNKYQLSRKIDKGFQIFKKKLFLNGDADFFIEANMVQTAGSTTVGYGVVFAADGISDYSCFSITSNGYYAITGCQTDIYQQYTPWRQIKNVQPLNSDNKLGILKKGDVFSFYLNDIKLTEVENVKMLGSEIGFLLTKNMSVQVKSITVRHPDYSINLAPAPEAEFAKENLGINVNSKYDETSPVIAADGKSIYFCRPNDPANTNFANGANNDVWYAKQNDKNEWLKAINIGKPINNAGANSIISISPDNNTLFISNTYRADGSYDDKGVSISKKTATGWALPKKVNITNLYNKNKYTGNCISSDGKVLIQAIECDNSRGDLDLYVSFRQDDDTWSEPQNMGKDINTKACDFAPFLASDNSTLYFATYGRPGFGSADIYISRRLDDSWTNWSEPQNIGDQINTANWDAYFTLTANGEYAYLVSTEKSFGGTDIFRIKLPATVKPKPVVMIAGKVYNQKTNEPIGTDITVENLTDNTELALANSNPSDGTYKLVLTSGKKYSFFANRKGFYSVSENFDATKIDEYKELNKNLYLAPLEKGMIIRLNNLFFESGKSNLLPTSFGELDRLVQVLKNNATMEVEIMGHTDNVGNDNVNLTLSNARANAVVTYIKAKGIDPKRLQPKGYGKTMPLVPNDTEEQRTQNRRVEFKITNI